MAVVAAIRCRVSFVGTVHVNYAGTSTPSCVYFSLAWHCTASFHHTAGSLYPLWCEFCIHSHAWIVWHDITWLMASLLQVHKAVEFSHGRLPKVLPVLLALKEMRKVAGQADLVDEMARPSVDTFVYALQKKVALAVSQDIIRIDEASVHVCSFLEQSGWSITPEFRDAVSQVFTNSSRLPAR